MILDGALASRADNDDPIDLAVLGGLDDTKALQDYTITHFQPFDPVHKRTEATVTATDGTTFKVTKGAPQVILALAANAAQIKPAVDKAVNDFAARGFRSLGVARADGDGDWQFWVCCRCSTRPATTRQRPSPPRGRWASPSRW